MGKSLVHYFVSDNDQREPYVNEMRPLAKKYHEYLAFTTIDSNEYPDMLGMLGLTGQGLSVQNPNNGDVFPYPSRQPVTAVNVEQFLMGIIQGHVKPWNGEFEQASGHDEL